MNLEQLDNHQLEQLETRLFEEFTELDQLIADKQRQLRQIETLLTHIVATRKARQDEEIGPMLQEVDVDRAVSPPVYADDRLTAPEDPSTSHDDIFRSGPFEIRRDESGEISSVACNLGRHVLQIQKETDSTANWGIREKTNISSMLNCLSPQSMGHPSP